MFRLKLTLHANFVCMLVNPLKPSVVMWLHFECSAPYWSNLPLFVSNVQALWRHSARISEIKNGWLDLYGKV